MKFSNRIVLKHLKESLQAFWNMNAILYFRRLDTQHCWLVLLSFKKTDLFLAISAFCELCSFRKNNLFCMPRLVFHFPINRQKSRFWSVISEIQIIVSLYGFVSKEVRREMTCYPNGIPGTYHLSFWSYIVHSGGMPNQSNRV